MEIKVVRPHKLIRNRTEALAYFRSRSDYYNRKAKLYECQGDNCGRMLPESEIVDDHIDNDRTNNKRTNHQPLCKSCNTHNHGKTDEQMKKIIKRRRRQSDLTFNKSSDMSPQITINRAAEEPFKKWVVEQVRIYGSISWIDLVDAGSEYVTQNHISLSQPTADRYLRKLTSFIGPLIAIGVGNSRQVELRDKSKEASDSSSGPS